jgi:stage II sporulation protein D
LTLRLLEKPSEGDRIRLGRLAGWDALPSNSYTAVRFNERIEFHGSGFGHGVGLCQHGAAALAESGTGFEGILRHYFLNTTLGALAGR